MSTEDIKVTDNEARILVHIYVDGKVGTYYQNIIDGMIRKGLVVRNGTRRDYLLTYRGLEVARQLGIGAENGGAQ